MYGSVRGKFANLVPSQSGRHTQVTRFQISRISVVGGRVTVRLISLEAIAPQLLAEAGARLHGSAEFSLAEDIGIERFGRHDRRVARHPADR